MFFPLKYTIFCQTITQIIGQDFSFPELFGATCAWYRIASGSLGCLARMLVPLKWEVLLSGGSLLDWATAGEEKTCRCRDYGVHTALLAKCMLCTRHGDTGAYEMGPGQRVETPAGTVLVLKEAPVSSGR